jgi:hypothetical protein
MSDPGREHPREQNAERPQHAPSGGGTPE